MFTLDLNADDVLSLAWIPLQIFSQDKNPLFYAWNGFISQASHLVWSWAALATNCLDWKIASEKKNIRLL